MKRSLVERYRIERLNRLIVERTVSRGTAPSKVFQTWAYLTLNGPKTVSELQAELPKTLSSNTAINFCVSNNVLLRNGNVISANPTYDWDGEGKKVGLIPDAIAACNKNGTEENQEKCIDIINYLSGKFNFQINPLYFRGAVVHDCYDLAKFLYKKIEKDLQNYEEVNKDFFRNKTKGLLVRTKGRKLPSDIIGIILNMAITKNLDSDTIGDLFIMAADDSRLLKKIAPKINLKLNQDDAGSFRVVRAINNIKKNNTEVYDKLKKAFKLD